MVSKCILIDLLPPKNVAHLSKDILVDTILMSTEQKHCRCLEMPQPKIMLFLGLHYS